MMGRGEIQAAMRTHSFFATLFIVGPLALLGADIHLRLVDHANEPVKEAEARLTNTQSGEEVVLNSDERGKLTFAGLPPGPYLLEAVAKEHIPAKSEPLELLEKDVEVTLKLAGAEAYRKLEEAGNAAHNQRNYREAIGQYEKAVEMAPQNPVGWANLARAYAGLRDPKQTSEAAQKAAALQPHEFGALEGELQGWIKYEQGWDHLEQREFVKAIELLTESVKRSANSAMSYYALAMAYAHQGRTADAFEHVQQALKLKPDDAESRKLKGILERRLGSSPGP